MHFNELDPVRVINAMSGKDPWRTGKTTSVPAGQGGTVIVGGPGCTAYDVEFMLYDGDSPLPYSAFLIVPADNLEVYSE